MDAGGGGVVVALSGTDYRCAFYIVEAESEATGTRSGEKKHRIWILKDCI